MLEDGVEWKTITQSFLFNLYLLVRKKYYLKVCVYEVVDKKTIDHLDDNLFNSGEG